MPTVRTSESLSSLDREVRPEALVLCGGRHAAEVIDALLACGIPIHGCLDAHLARGTEVFPGVSVIGSDDDLTAMIGDGYGTVYLGIGGLENLDARMRLFGRLKELGAAQPPLIHPSAHVADSATIGSGTTILARASVGPLSQIGENCILTQGSVVTHHCQIGDHVVLAPNATLAAGVTVGSEATIGMGVTVYHDVTIGKRSIIVNGIAVMQDVPDDCVMKHRSVPIVSPRTP